MSGKEILLFCLRLVALAPIVTVAWWFAIPYYGYAVGNAAGVILKDVCRRPVELPFQVVKEPKQDTKAWLAFPELRFKEQGKERRFEQFAALVANIAPYIALILATPGLKSGRRLKILAAGLAILAAGHILYLVLTFIFAAQIGAHPDLPTALAQVFIALPFLLWIVLAYWDKLAAFFSEER